MRASAAGNAGETEQRGGTAEPATSIGQTLMALLRDLPGLISDRVHLLALELRRARQSFVHMAIMVVVAAILAATAWVAFWALVAVVVVAMGVPWYGVFALIVVLNCLGGWFAIRRAQALVEDLTLPATVRRLTIAPSPTPDSASPTIDPTHDLASPPPPANPLARSGVSPS